MIDYKFSELKAHCDNMFEIYGEKACEKCGESEIGLVCLSYFENGVSSLPVVEPRDMIDLPCKVRFEGKVLSKTVVGWQVVSRKDDGCVWLDWFTNEVEAEKFLLELKGEKK